MIVLLNYREDGTTPYAVFWYAPNADSVHPCSVLAIC
jgi:hypothetical protein